MFLTIKKTLLSIAEKQWKEESNYILRKQKYQNKKDTLQQQTKKKIPTSKLLILFLFITCTAIMLFTGWATVQMLNIALIAGTAIDFSPLVTLIGAVLGEVIGYAIYALKSSKENTAGGIVYDSAMKQNNQDTVDYFPDNNEVG